MIFMVIRFFKTHLPPAYLKSVGIPATRIYVSAQCLTSSQSDTDSKSQTGLFTEYIPWLVDYPNGGKVKVIGKGEQPVSFTSVSDIAGAALSTFEPGRA